MIEIIKNHAPAKIIGRSARRGPAAAIILLPRTFNSDHPTRFAPLKYLLFAAAISYTGTDARMHV